MFRTTRRRLTATGLLALAAPGLMDWRSALAQSAATPSPDVPYEPVINPDDFSTTIDNRYFPLVPGTTFVFEGTTDGSSERDEVTVTGDTKTILGVTCVVVHDRAMVDGELAEETNDWYAQDAAGNVWYFGEATTAYDGGKTSTEGSWEAGVDGAQPGIIMPATLDVGATYRQEYSAGVAEDIAEILKLGESVAVPYGSFDDVLVTREWSPLEPDVEEEKSYAPGVGVILERSTRGEHDRLELVAIETTGAATPVATPAG